MSEPVELIVVVKVAVQGDVARVVGVQAEVEEGSAPPAPATLQALLLEAADQVDVGGREGAGWSVLRASRVRPPARRWVC